MREELQMWSSPPPSSSFSVREAGDPSLGTEALHTVRDPTGGAPPGAQERGPPKAGAAAGGDGGEPRTAPTKAAGSSQGLRSAR